MQDMPHTTGQRFAATVCAAFIIAVVAGACASGPVHDKFAFQGTVVEQLELKGSQRMMPAPMPGGGSILVPVGEPSSYRLVVRGDDGRMRDVITFRKADNGSCIAVFVPANMPDTITRFAPHEATVKPGSGCAKG